jgi:hypothetical protein
MGQSCEKSPLNYFEGPSYNVVTTYLVIMMWDFLKQRGFEATLMHYGVGAL